MFAVGVTHHINQEELECIASQKDSLHVFNLDTFKDVEHFNKEIQKRSSRGQFRVLKVDTLQIAKRNRGS